MHTCSSKSIQVRHGIKSRINRQTSVEKDKIWRVNLVILIKLWISPQAAHDWWPCGSPSTEPLHSVAFKGWPSESHFLQTAQHVWEERWSYVGRRGKVTNMSRRVWWAKKPLGSRNSPFLLTPPHNTLPPSRQTDKDKCHSQVSWRRRGPKGCRIIFFFFSCLMMWFCFLQK